MVAAGPVLTPALEPPSFFFKFPLGKITVDGLQVGELLIFLAGQGCQIAEVLAAAPKDDIKTVFLSVVRVRQPLTV